MAYTEDLKSIRPICQHRAPQGNVAQMSSVYAASGRLLRAAPRTVANGNEKPTDTATDTGN
jgi:hypothetical protein